MPPAVVVTTGEKMTGVDAAELVDAECAAVEPDDWESDELDEPAELDAVDIPEPEEPDAVDGFVELEADDPEPEGVEPDEGVGAAVPPLCGVIVTVNDLFGVELPRESEAMQLTMCDPTRNSWPESRLQTNR